MMKTHICQYISASNSLHEMFLLFDTPALEPHRESIDKERQHFRFTVDRLSGFLAIGLN
jgi:hypothetical protein